jgi:L-asparaginase II
MRLHVEVAVRRGEILEARHRVHVAVTDPEGTVIAGSQTPDHVTTFRSSAKPFQLLPLVERGHADRWALSDEELAVMAASHTGSARHLELVRGILDRLGLKDSDLVCGYHEPLDPVAREHLARHPEARSNLYNNCSGKHAGMLCLARSEGWPIAGYERPEHPLQQLLRRTVAELAGMNPETMALAVDGCNVPVFALPLTGMARAYARLATAGPQGGARATALARIRGAMCAYPDAVGGTGRFSTALMRAASGHLVAKGGAEGLECVGSPERGLGLAVKVEDGAARAAAPATLAVLEKINLLAPPARAALTREARPVILNAAGREVGTIEAVVHELAHATD